MQQNVARTRLLCSLLEIRSPTYHACPPYSVVLPLSPPSPRVTHFFSPPPPPKKYLLKLPYFTRSVLEGGLQVPETSRPPPKSSKRTEWEPRERQILCLHRPRICSNRSREAFARKLLASKGIASSPSRYHCIDVYCINL